MKLSNETLRLIRQLPEAKRARVERVVRTHLSACHKNGCPLGSLDRIYLEAVEAVDLEARRSGPPATPFRDWEPARRYDQYISPRDL